MTVDLRMCLTEKYPMIAIIINPMIHHTKVGIDFCTGFEMGSSLGIGVGEGVGVSATSDKTLPVGVELGLREGLGVLVGAGLEIVKLEVQEFESAWPSLSWHVGLKIPVLV